MSQRSTSSVDFGLAAAVVLTLSPLAVHGAIGIPEQPEILVTPAQDLESVLSFWTDARMSEAARSAIGGDTFPEEDPITPGDPTRHGYVEMPRPYLDNIQSRQTGMLFVDYGNDQLTHCSASVTHSLQGNTILTAAHCMLDVTFSSEPKFYTKMMLVPAYDGTKVGSEAYPLGRWVINRGFLYKLPTDENGDTLAEYDMALGSVYPSPDKPGQTLQQAVGGAYRVRLSQHELFDRVHLIGYPNGELSTTYAGLMWTCLSRTDDGIFFPVNLRLPNCALQGGNSGGPILVVSPQGYPEQVAIGTKTSRNGQTRLTPSNFPRLFQAAVPPTQEHSE